MSSLPDSKVFKRYMDLGFIVDGSFKKRSADVLIEHAYAKFPRSKHTFLVLLPSLQQMEHFSRFMRTVLALAASSMPREFRFRLKAGLLLVIPPDEWIDKKENFRDLASSTKFSLPVVEQWTRTFSGGIHRQSSTPMVSVTKGQHEQLAHQFEQATHQAELFEGDRVSDPPYENAFFDKLCANVEILNKRFDQKAAAVRKASSAAKRRGASVDGRVPAPGGSEARLEWLDLQQALGAVDFASTSIDTGRRAVLQMSTPPIYAANTEGSVFSDACRHFNLADLGTMLDHHPTVPGVNGPPYLYVGMKSTMAPWHIEDGRLYSIFYLHAKSSAKFWYSIDASKSREFEKVMADLFPAFRQKCRRFLDHKEFFAAPELLAQKGLPVNVLVQLESTFVITLCDVYHAVLNSGYSLGTAINFALEPWYDCGLLVQERQLCCKHDLCAKKDGLNSDGSKADMFYYISGIRPDGTSYSTRMSRRRGVVHISMNHFSEHMRSMQILGGHPSFYLDGFSPFGVFWTASTSAAASSDMAAGSARSMVLHAASQTSQSEEFELSAAMASAVGRFLAEGSWRLAEAPSDDALILAGYARKAARGQVDVSALVAVLRTMPSAVANPRLLPTVTESPPVSASGSPSLPAAAGIHAVRAVPVSSADPGGAASALMAPRSSVLPAVAASSSACRTKASSSISAAVSASAARSSASSTMKRPHFIKRTGGAPQSYKRPKKKCHHCGQLFSRSCHAMRHMANRVCQKNARDLLKLPCDHCGKVYQNADSLWLHRYRSDCGKAEAGSSAAASGSVSQTDVAESMLLD